MAPQVLRTDPDQTISGTHEFQTTAAEYRQLGVQAHAIADESRGIEGAAQVGRVAVCERIAAACDKVATTADTRSTGIIDLTAQNGHNADETASRFGKYDPPIQI